MCSNIFTTVSNIGSIKRKDKIPINNITKISIANKTNSFLVKSLNALKLFIFTLPKNILLYVHNIYTAPQTILVDAIKVTVKLY